MAHPICYDAWGSDVDVIATAFIRPPNVLSGVLSHWIKWNPQTRVQEEDSDQVIRNKTSSLPSLCKAICFLPYTYAKGKLLRQTWLLYLTLCPHPTPCIISEFPPCSVLRLYYKILEFFLFFFVFLEGCFDLFFKSSCLFPCLFIFQNEMWKAQQQVRLTGKQYNSVCIKGCQIREGNNLKK